MSETIRVTQHDDVTELTLARPEKLNALSPGLLRDVETALSNARDQGAVIVNGAGPKAFSAGADIEHGHELSTEEAYEYVALTNRVFDAVEAFPRPIIASIDGFALGGGLELALACDFRLGSERSELGLPEIDIGAVPGTGGLHRLPGIVGDQRARRLVFTGDLLDAATAAEWGLLGDVYPHDELDDRVRALATTVAEKPPFAVAAAKRGLNDATRPDAGAIEFETWMVTAIYGTAAYREGIEEFLDEPTSE